jgi:polyhydroxyalkanoate synthesis regulator phasin
MSTETTVTDTTDAAPKRDMLKELHGEWVKNGSKELTSKEAKELTGRLKNAIQEKDAAEKAFVSKQAALSDVWADLVRKCGKGRINIPGMGLVTPMSKGDTCFGRAEGGANVRTLGG